MEDKNGTPYQSFHSLFESLNSEEIGINKKFYNKYANLDSFIEEQNYSIDIETYLNFLGKKSLKIYEEIKSSYSVLNFLRILITNLTSYSINEIHFFLHPPGESRAFYFNQQNEVQSYEVVSLGMFNQFFHTIERSRQKNFHPKKFNNAEFKLLGNSYGFTLIIKGMRLIFLIGRGELIDFTKQENDELNLLSQVMGIALPNVLKNEVTQKENEYRIQILDLFPEPIEIINLNNNQKFQNQSLTTSISNSILLVHKINQFQLNIFNKTEYSNHEQYSPDKNISSLLADLFNILRHELSNPLFGLKLSANLLGSMSKENEEREFTEEIEKTIQRAETILESMSNLFAHSATLNSCNLRQSLQETLTLCKSETRGMEVIFKWNKELDIDTSVMIDSISLFQVIFNLVINAAQAMNSSSIAKKCITIDVSSDNNIVIINITDTGPGLPPQIQANIFQPFQTTKEKGHGLGLLISRNLILRAKGELNYIPTLGDGCHFEIKIPIT